MRVALFTALVGILASAVAATAIPQKAVIVTYPDNTPPSVLDEAKNAIKKAGGVITHEYKIINGFAARASQTALEAIRAMGERFNAVIEEDQEVHTMGGEVSTGSTEMNIDGFRMHVF